MELVIALIAYTAFTGKREAAIAILLAWDTGLRIGNIVKGTVRQYIYSGHPLMPATATEYFWIIPE